MINPLTLLSFKYRLLASRRFSLADPATSTTSATLAKPTTSSTIATPAPPAIPGPPATTAIPAPPATSSTFAALLTRLTRLTLLTFLAFLPILVIFPPLALAQSGIQLSVTPPVSYIRVSPGQSQTHEISLKNGGTEPIMVTPKIVDFTPDIKTGAPVLSDKLSFPYFTRPSSGMMATRIEAGQTAKLQFKIEPPLTAPEREYPISIVFSADKPDSITGSTSGSAVGGPAGASISKSADEPKSRVSGAVASNLIILVSDKDKLEKKLSVQDFGVTKIVDSFQELNPKPIVRNERFSANTASGSAKLVSWTGKTIKEYKIYPDNILGLSTRGIRASESADDLLSIVDFRFKPALMIGPYKFIITLDNDNQIDQFSKNIIALPFSVGVVALVGVGVATIYWFKIKKRGRENDAEDGENKID